jgi:hypothetical protein
MRTDPMRARPLALACAALLFGAAGPLSAQDSLVLDASLPAAAAATQAAQGANVRRSGDVLQLRGDRSIPAGEVVEGDVVLLNGSLTLGGEVTGDVTVSRGDLVLLPGASIRGDAVVTGGRLVNRGATVGGEMRVADAARAMAAQGGRAASRARFGRSFIAPIGTGMIGLMETLAFGLVLAGIGLGVIFYGQPQLRRLSETIRTDTMRAAGVGLAASFLTLPAFIVGAVALGITIVGIPLLLLYLPLFWVAVFAAAALGLVAVAQAIGERSAEQREGAPAPERNPYAHLFTGLALLLAPLVASHLLQMTGVLGFVGDLLRVAAWIGLWLAACVGGGAVLLVGSRAWREHRYRRMMGVGEADARAV